MTSTGTATPTSASLEQSAREGAHPAHSFHAHDHRRGLGPSDLLPFRGRTHGRDVLPRHEIRSWPIRTRLRATASCFPRDMPRRFFTPRWLSPGCFPVSRLMTLRQFSSELEGHPTPRIPGVDAATGSLGQGLSVGAGLGAGRAHPEIAGAHLCADGRRRNGRRQRLGSRGVRRRTMRSTI